MFFRPCTRDGLKCFLMSQALCPKKDLLNPACNPRANSGIWVKWSRSLHLGWRQGELRRLHQYLGRAPRSTLRTWCRGRNFYFPSGITVLLTPLAERLPAGGGSNLRSGRRRLYSPSPRKAKLCRRLVESRRPTRSWHR